MGSLLKQLLCFLETRKTNYVDPSYILCSLNCHSCCGFRKNIPENCAFCLVRSMRHVLTVLIKGPSPPCTMLGLPPMATATFETSVHPKACLALRICTVAIGNHELWKMYSTITIQFS